MMQIAGRWEKLYNSGSSSIQYGTDCLTLTTTGTTDFIISEEIDFSDYHILYYEFEADAINNTFFGIMSSKYSSNPMSRTDYGYTQTIIKGKSKVYQLKNRHYLAKIDLTSIGNGYVALEGSANTIKVYSVYLR